MDEWAILFSIILLASLVCVTLSLIALVRASSVQQELNRLRHRVDDLMLRLGTAESKLRKYSQPDPTAPKTTTAETSPSLPEKEPAEIEKTPPEIVIPQNQKPPLSYVVPIAAVTKTKAENENPAAAPASVSENVSEVAMALGESSASPKPSFESVVGRLWMTWVGVAILFFSAAFFLKYAFENDLIGPLGQVTLCALTGIAVLIGGTRFLRKNMIALGQGLLGLGLAILFVTFSAASSIYDPVVLAQTPAFLFLCTVTICGMSLAVLHNASAVAILALLGGLATPLLVSSGHNSRDALFIYLLILNCGVFGVALFRKWRVLDTIAIIGSYILYSGWFEKYYTPAQISPALLWLAAFYLLFFALPFVFSLVRKTAVTVERFILALLNAVFAFGFAWYILHEKHPQTLGFIALGMAFLYLGMGMVFRRRLPTDTKTLFGSIALAVTFITMAFPLHLRAQGITLAWVVEGPVLLYLGYKFRYAPVRIFGALVLLLSLVRLFFVHLPLHQELYEPFINRRFLSAILVPLGMGVYAVIHHLHRVEGTVTDRVSKLIFGLGGGLLGLFLVQLEGSELLRFQHREYFAICFAAAVWLVGSWGYLFALKTTRSLATWVVGCLALFVSLAQVFFSLDLSRTTSSLLFLNFRFIVGAGVITTLWGFGKIIRVTPLRAGEPLPAWGKTCWGLGIFLLWGLLSYEIPSFVRESMEWSIEAAQMSLTVTWGGYAAALLALGFWRDVRPLRYCALSLFGISALKLLIIDMSQEADLLRIGSFMVVGILMLIASYFYHRLEKNLARETPSESADRPSEEGAKEDAKGGEAK